MNYENINKNNLGALEVDQIRAKRRQRYVGAAEDVQGVEVVPIWVKATKRRARALAWDVQTAMLSIS